MHLIAAKTFFTRDRLDWRRPRLAWLLRRRRRA